MVEVVLIESVVVAIQRDPFLPGQLAVYAGEAFLLLSGRHKLFRVDDAVVVEVVFIKEVIVPKLGNPFLPREFVIAILVGGIEVFLDLTCGQVAVRSQAMASCQRM